MKNDQRALLLGLFAVLLWSTAATAFKLALGELSVLQLLCVAIWVSAAALLGTLAWQGRLGLLWQELRSAPLGFLAMAALNPLLYYCVLLAAYDLLPAQQAQTINYTWAITLALLSIPVLGQRLGLRDWLAIGLGYFGVIIIATEGNPFSLTFTSGVGVLLALGSTVIWAVFWLLSARSKGDAAISLAAYFVCAAPVSLLLCMIWGGGLPPPGGALASAVYVGLFEMGFTWLLWSTALRLASNVSRVGNLIFLSPMLSLVFIALILGERIHPATLLGLALILPGIVLQQRSPKLEAP
ncbi:DMT family transporter [Congregibacter litoralis]|uniref:Putative permease n=1 Tax=Congregibacter litoralis KT71 TaxID=314285 RepID=A4A8Q1_9GAMM|nr:DMT family transporter [Congregibacter litoralis]EAQ97443.1 putative permease [Congregibacter litoralis KT71]